MAEPSRSGAELSTAAGATAWWHALVRFGIHVLVGTLIFVIIASAAFALAFVISWLEEKQLEQSLIWGLKLAEYALFVVDLVLFFVFLGRTTGRALKEL